MISPTNAMMHNAINPAVEIPVVADATCDTVAVVEALAICEIIHANF